MKSLQEVMGLIDGTEYRIARTLPEMEYCNETGTYDAEVSYRNVISELVSYCVEVVRAETGERIYAKYFGIYANGAMDHEKWIDQETGKYLEISGDDVWKYTAESLQYDQK